MNDYPGGGRRPKSRKERFNYHHSSLRMVTERRFGVLKAIFPILEIMPFYPLDKQRFIIIPACAVNKFIRKRSHRDYLFIDAKLGKLDNLSGKENGVFT